MDINTKPKQGAVFWEFPGQVMGISGDYVDSVFEHSIYLWPPNSPVGYKPRDPTAEPTLTTDRTMLPVPKDSVAPQEWVGKDTIMEPADGGTAEVAICSKMGDDSDQWKEKAPLLWVHGERQSPGVYRSLRLLGRPLEVAWKRAFIARPTF